MKVSEPSLDWLEQPLFPNFHGLVVAVTLHHVTAVETFAQLEGELACL